MAEDIMPATEAETVVETAKSTDDAGAHYELAFHILPTVAEEEVATVQEALAAVIKEAEGDVAAEEAAARYDLAYNITQPVDGKNRKFTSSYFGWIRFTLAADVLERVKESLDGRTDLLRYMIVKLTKEEVAHPFKVYEKKVPIPMASGESDEIIETKSEEEDKDEEVQEEELDESLEKITQ